MIEQECSVRMSATCLLAWKEGPLHEQGFKFVKVFFCRCLRDSDLSWVSQFICSV